MGHLFDLTFFPGTGMPALFSDKEAEAPDSGVGAGDSGLDPRDGRPLLSPLPLFLQHGCTEYGFWEQKSANHPGSGLPAGPALT